jgi:hypothetical protein
MVPETRSIETGTPPLLLPTIWNESSLESGCLAPSHKFGRAGRSPSGAVYDSAVHDP